MITRTATAFDDRIYPAEWRSWQDPQIPEHFNGVEILFTRHLRGPTADKAAVIADDVAHSYRDLWSLVVRAASGLRALGLRPGERILLFGTDSVEYLATWLGAVYAGIVPAVVSDLYKTPELLYFLDDTAARALFIDAEQLGKLDEISARLPDSLEHIIIRGDGVATAPSYPSRTSSTLAALLDNAVEISPYQQHRNDICYMFYSGGTTGTAKGIIHLAHDFILVPARQGAFWNYQPDDVVFATSRKYFTHGLWPGVLIPLSIGATCVIQRPAPNPAALLATVEKARVTKLITVPTIIKMMVEHRGSDTTITDFSSVTMVVSASEKMPPSLFERFSELFGVEIFDSIGSAEVTYEWIANRPGQSRRGSLGKPVFGYEIRLVDADGHDVVQPNVPGQVWVKSKTSCFFYWRKFDKSRETFVGPWAITGDNLYFDEDGFYWFAGREDDVFKVKGLWVSPIEIEAAITAHPTVLEAAVVAVTNAEGLTVPHALVVLRAGMTADDTLVTELKNRVKALGGYKVPEKIDFVEQLPRTTLLKIDRRAIRLALAAARG